MVSHHRWNALSLEYGAGDSAHEAAPGNVSNAIPQRTKQQLRGLIAAFAVLTLLLIMSTVSLGAVTLSVQAQHHTRGPQLCDTTATVLPLKTHAGSGVRKTPVYRRQTSLK